MENSPNQNIYQWHAIHILVQGTTLLPENTIFSQFYSPGVQEETYRHQKQVLLGILVTKDE